MKPLQPLSAGQSPSTNPTPSTVSQQTAAHWAQQLVKLFPSTAATVLTTEFLAAVVAILMEYPEKVVSVVCNPGHGICSKQDFFPTLSQLKGACDNASFEHQERFRRERASTSRPETKPAPDPFAGCYTGPIEYVKPGDVLHYTRFDEYREFMRTKKNIPNVKLWGLNETWVDNHQRPFQVDIKPEAQIKEEINPFEG